MSSNAFNTITNQPNTMTNFKNRNNFVAEYKKLNINSLDENTLNRMGTNDIPTSPNQNQPHTHQTKNTQQAQTHDWNWK